jgi:DNA repair photolyase
MVKVIRKQRKPPILTASSIPCLKQLPTVNVTQGCALGCTYCYIRSYRSYPGPETIILFENTAEVLSDELKRKRKPPARVYFSPSSDAFQYLPEVQAVSLASMRVLLEQDIEVAFLTKGFIAEPFLDLFEHHYQGVVAQIGITSLDRRLWRVFEPRTAPPEQRIESAKKLRQAGVEVTARIDPLIPDVTDTPENLAPLLEKLADAGITFAAASYIFLRSGFGRSLAMQVAECGCDPSGWPRHAFGDGCGGGSMIPVEERRQRFEYLGQLGQSYGITIQPCRCKNPTLTSKSCRIAGCDSAPGQHAAPIDPLLPFSP